VVGRSKIKVYVMAPEKKQAAIAASKALRLYNFSRAKVTLKEEVA